MATLGPQRGRPQEAFLASSADIVIFGGGAGGGKTYGALLEPCRHLANPGFGAVIFRRTGPQITQTGGLWEEAGKIYPVLGGKPITSPNHEFRFPSGATVQFRHLQHNKNRYDWKGAQIPLIIFDQLEEFEKEQFWYMLSRNRSTCGVQPYLRATCNPDADSFVADLISWWWDPDTGYPIKERSGVVRWFVRLNEVLVWGSSRKECIAKALKIDKHSGPYLPKSLTFIPANLSDNPILEAIDPGYRANLMAMSKVERERLLGGNWLIRATAGNIYNSSWFDIVPASPKFGRRVRYWDKAGTPGGGDATSSVLLLEADPTKGAGYGWYVEDRINVHLGLFERERLMRQTAILDRANYGDVAIWIEQEGGSGGKDSAKISTLNLKGFDVHTERPTGDKLTRAKPSSAQAEAGNIAIVEAPWNKEFLDNLHRFDGEDGGRDDDVDAFSGAFNKLSVSPSYVTDVSLPVLLR